MILIDTGPLVALLDAGDVNHAACIAALKRLPPQPLLTTWPCFTEAMYLLGKVGGHRYQEQLWRLQATGRLVLYAPVEAEVEYMRAFMAQYRDAPMDLADASLVAAAEVQSLHQIFTFDSHFYAYRLQDGTTLEIIS